MKNVELVLANESGLHARPGKDFVQLAKGFESVVTVIKGGERYNGKSLMKLMQAGLSKGDTFQIEAEGEDEDKAIEALTDYIKNLRE